MPRMKPVHVSLCNSKKMKYEYSLSVSNKQPKQQVGFIIFSKDNSILILNKESNRQRTFILLVRLYMCSTTQRIESRPTFNLRIANFRL